MRTGNAKFNGNASLCHPCSSEFPTDQRIPAVIAAFCCLADFASPVESKRKLVGAVGIEPGRPPNSQQSATDKPQSKFAMLLSPNNLHSSRANCRLLPPRQFGVHLLINDIRYEGRGVQTYNLHSNGCR